MHMVVFGDKRNRQMKYSIEIDHDHRLIRYRHSGNIPAEDIEAAWGEFLTYKEFTELKYNLLSDYSGGIFQIPPEFLPEIIRYMQQIESIVRGKKQALIVDEPYSVAASMLFEAEVYDSVGFIVRAFSTEKAALKWLAE